MKAIKPLPEVLELFQELIALRRHLHSIPEIGFQEVKTAAFIVQKLREYGVEEIHEGVGRTGVVALIKGTKTATAGGRATAEKCVALRADMDGLPVLELEHERTATFRSTHEGKMHACGHDGHVAGLLIAAKIMQQQRHTFSGIVKLIFQPAEEGLGGAQAMVNDGVMGENRKLGPKPDELYGLHLISYLPTGVLDVSVGSMMASSERFLIKLIGSGGHGAMPHATRDPIVAAAHLIVALQSIVSRNVSPLDSAVVTVGQISAGTAFNVIPSYVQLTGTIRTFKPATVELVIERLRSILKGIETGFSMNTELTFDYHFPPTINTVDAGVEVVRRAAAQICTVRNAEPTMGAEDFSEFALKVPHGCFFFVGANPTNKEDEMDSYIHHKDTFQISEDALLVSTSLFVNIVRETLG